MALNYRRGYNWEQQEYVPAPIGGWAPDAPAWELAETQAQQLDNFLIRPGKIVLRGPFRQLVDFSTTGGLSPALPLNVGGVVIGDGSWVLIGRKALSSTAYLDPWFAHFVRQGSTAALAAPDLQLLSVLTTSGVVTPLAAATSLKIPGPNWVSFNGSLYGLCYADTAFGPITYAGGYVAQTTRVVQIIDGSGPPALTAITLASGPVGGIDLAAHLDRLWVLGGASVQPNTQLTNPGGQVGSSTALFYTRPIESLSGATADWTDPTSGLTNKIVIDEDYSNPGVAVAKCNSGLLLFRRNSVHIVRGTVPANFQVQTVSRDVGCIDPRSVVETDNGVYFISHRGCMWTDGSRVRNISGVMQERFNVLLGTFLNNVYSGTGGYCTVAPTSDNQLLVTIGVNGPIASTTPSGHSITLFSGLYNPDLQAWTRVTSSLWTNDALSLGPANILAPQVYGKSDRVYAIGDRYLTELEDLNKSALSASVGQATSAVDDASTGTVAWANPGDLVGPGPAPAMNILAPFNPAVFRSHYLKATGFGFAVPAGATVQGIQLAVYRGTFLYDPATQFTVDAHVQLVKAGVIQPTDRADTSTHWASASGMVAQGWRNYGGPNDLWGTTWTPAQINAANFGAALAAAMTSNVQSNSDIATYLIYLNATVYFTTAAGQFQSLSSFVRVSDGFDYPVSGSPVVVPALWQSRLLGLGSVGSRKRGQLKEVYYDHVLQATNNLPTNGWTVDLLDESEKSLLGPQVIAGQLNPSPTTLYDRPRAIPNVQRQNYDIAREVVNASVSVTWAPTRNASGSPIGLLAEVHGAGLEFQPTSDIR